MRFVKFLIGLLMVPLCVAATRAVFKLVLDLKPLAGFTASAWGFVIGFVFFVILYLALPAPMKTYVLAHELTHALWGVAMGARVKHMKVKDSGGSVTLTKSNVLITLAPYIFPLYTVLLVIAYLACNHFFDVRAYRPLWYGLLGLTWAFHLVFTLRAAPAPARHHRAWPHLFLGLDLSDQHADAGYLALRARRAIAAGLRPAVAQRVHVGLRGIRGHHGRPAARLPPDFLTGQFEPAPRARLVAINS